MRELLTITKALADESRLRALSLLESKELCLCQIVEVLGLAVSTVSKHMAILHQARLVEARKQGRWAYFRLANKDAPCEVKQALDLVLKNMSHTTQYRTDQQSLRKVIKIEPEELCRRQANCKC